MESPEPVRAHRKLEKLAGHFEGPERMHPSYWNDENRTAEAVTDAQVTLDGFAVVQDYEQRLDDGTRFAGHGVFRYDMPSDTYEMHWFDSTGGPVRVFRGGFEGRLLVLTARVGEGWQRLTYDFNLKKGYRFKLETSQDGQRWNLALEGENFESPPRRRRTDRKAAGKKTAKKTGAKKASAKKATAKKAATKKSAAKKTSAKKAAAKKTGTKKAVAEKSVTKKSVTKKAGAKKTAARNNTTEKKAGAKKTAGKKPAVRVSDVERRRRQGKASKKTATRRGDGREEQAAPPANVSQQKRKSAAQSAPRMPNLKKTSTRVGWHKTAARGKRENP